MRRQVAVTGMGVVSAIGCSTDSFFHSLVTGRSGARRSAVDPDIAVAEVDFVPEDHFSRMALTVLDRFSQFTLLAAEQAVKEAGLREADFASGRVGIYFGSGVGGAGALEAGYRSFLSPEPRVAPLTILLTMANAGAAHVSLRYGIRGPSLTYSLACASANVAIGEAYRAIRDGYLDLVIAGGAEALLTPGTVAAWKALRVLATPDADHPERSCRPFSRNRSGLVLGEGAGVVVLEAAEHARRRGRTVTQELAGYAVTSDATHLTKPSPSGQATAMLAALDDAQLPAGAVDYVNAHGTGTLAGDATETTAIASALGTRARQVPISATKALHGHLLGASGAVELIATLLAMRSQTIPPTCHYDERDPDCDLDYVPNTARHGVPLSVALSNSFAFGGTNAVLVVKSASSH